MPELSEAQGLVEPVEYAGKKWLLEPLTFADLGRLDQLVGLTNFDSANADHRQKVLFLMLRKADPNLTPQQREDCQYLLTPAGVDRLFPASIMFDPETARAVHLFQARILAVSGLYGSPSEDAAPETESAKENTEPKKRRPAKTKA